MRYRLELRDEKFNILEILDQEYLDLNWSYSRIGGCGDFSFKLPRKLFEEKSIRGDFNIRIYNRNATKKPAAYDLWYQGLVEDKTPMIQGNTEEIQISGHGYSTQLSRLYIQNKTYTSQEVSVIVTDILDTFITPDTDITFDAGDIEVTTVTLNSIKFNETVKSAISKLADIVGTREWGVDKDRKFFFKARSTTVGTIIPLGSKLTNFSEKQDFSEITNHVLIQGAQVGGTYHTFGPYEELSSQAKFGKRQTIIQNGSITTDAVASQFATSIIDEFSDVGRKATVELVEYEIQIEATNPVDLVAIIGKEIKYGERKYGTFLYSGQVNRVVNRINYNVTNKNSLRVRLALGALKPLVSEEISQIEYELDQQRSASL